MKIYGPVSSSFSSFKYEIKRYNSTNHGVPQHYLYGDRYVSVMHARIRNECSNLNSDLHQIFLLINPFGNCNLEIENAEHYFFRCPNNLNERIRLFNETRTFHPLNLDIPQLAFYVNLHWAVIGPSATLTGRWRPDINLCRMLTGPTLWRYRDVLRGQYVSIQICSDIHKGYW